MSDKAGLSPVARKIAGRSALYKSINGELTQTMIVDELYRACRDYSELNECEIPIPFLKAINELELYLEHGECCDQ